MPWAYSPNMSLTNFTENQGHFNVGEEVFKKDWSETIEGGWQESNHPAKIDRTTSLRHSKG
jgi:hypothetical protein